MIHVFDTDVAKKYGVNAAIILQNMAYWIMQNEANEMNFYDGRYWTFNSKRAYGELFPYMSAKQIRTAIEKLVEDGVLVTGNYNKLAYDRTAWYSLTEKGKSICRIGQMDYPQKANGLSQEGKPIPDINSDVTHVVNTDRKKERKNNSFDSIIDLYLSPDGMSVRFEDHAERRELLQEWLKVRKAKRAVMTDRAIQMNIDKLDKLANESRMPVVEYLKEVIRRGWAAFYAINDYQRQGYGKKPVPVGASGNLGEAEMEAIQRVLHAPSVMPEPDPELEAQAEAFRKRLEEIGCV